jgi:hypothetical protein
MEQNLGLLVFFAKAGVPSDIFVAHVVVDLSFRRLKYMFVLCRNSN